MEERACVGKVKSEMWLLLFTAIAVNGCFDGSDGKQDHQLTLPVDEDFGPLPIRS